MDKRILQTYSTWAKENLENQIEVSLKALGINGDDDIKKSTKVGDVTTIEGDQKSYPADLYSKRIQIVNLVKTRGYHNVIEEFAYTWFNRFVALRFMEVHGFIPHGFRVLSNPSGSIEPEILQNLNLVKSELKLDMNICNEYKEQGKIEELYRYVLIKQCTALAGILPMLFSVDQSHLELLLPTSLLKGETVLTRLLEIPEEAFREDVEIIGWMYQFYISNKKDEVNASKKTITKDTLPAVTQLFTPDWIVRYMAQNSVGRLWLESYPNSTLRSEMKYYVDEAEQTEEVNKNLEEIRYKNVNPEEIEIVEPCCGSGHILVYVFDLLYKMYEERGYQKRDIPTLILSKNLTGLDVDKRAVQLASFALVMKARSVNNRFFDEKYYFAPRVYELQDSKLLEETGYRKAIRDLKLLNDDEIKTITYLADVFKDGKTIGSLLKLNPIDFELLDDALQKIETQSVMDTFNMFFLGEGMKRLHELDTLAKILSHKYDVMITNPPYRPISSMEDSVKEYASKEYPDSKTDMSAMFLETRLVKKHGFTAMINMHSWMFLSSYKKLRSNLTKSTEIFVMLHLGPHAFDSIGGEVVQTTAFVMRNWKDSSYEASYFRLIDAVGENEKENWFLQGKNKFIGNESRYELIPGQPYAYWIGEKALKAFKNKNLGSYAEIVSGMTTGNNDIYLKKWNEVSFEKIAFNRKKIEDVDLSLTKWIPYHKGGEMRKWYGNNEYVVNWSRSKEFNRAKTTMTHVYLKPCITWSDISGTSFAGRYCSGGFMFDVKGSCAFADEETLIILLGIFNSKVTPIYVEALNPTTTTQVGDLKRIPLVKPTGTDKNRVMELVRQNVELSSAEWDSFEISWDFRRHPLVPSAEEKREQETSQFAQSRMEKFGLISWHFKKWEEECQARFDKLKKNEEELNRIFIDIYGLQDELTPEVEDNDVTVRLADREREIKSLISYLVGVEMGRYSLDSFGLAYAGGDWEGSKYVGYQPDDDGIVPIYNKLGMEDGLTTKLIRLIKQIYGETSYRDNIDYIADALGKKNNESSEETLNRYLNEGFFADHLKIYQKRPIYWLFTSGKKAGFKCLIYMHRYNEDTLARINSKYFLPESTRKKNELDEINGRIARAEGRDKIRLEKERQKMAEAYNEAIEYGQVLDHMANRYITIDLDDGVKVNYAKFQGVEVVTDGGSKVKKDLLSPLK